jgi:hypothetical protein
MMHINLQNQNIERRNLKINTRRALNSRYSKNSIESKEGKTK